MTACLDRIDVYPIKSLDGVQVESATLRAGAGLRGDRRYRLADPSDGVVLTTKRVGAELVRLRTRYDLVIGRVEISQGSALFRAQLPEDSNSLAMWLSDRLARPVALDGGEGCSFPDDEDASGPTIISRATLQEVAEWFDLDEYEMRRRFRANLIVDGVPAFWEDRLYGSDEEPVRCFSIGEARFEAVNPCARCAVPSRDSYLGHIPEPAFAKIFAERRHETLPEWAAVSRFDHYFRLAVNTRVPNESDGETVRTGDPVTLE